MRRRDACHNGTSLLVYSQLATDCGLDARTRLVPNV
jgi:hypothetical protein